MHETYKDRVDYPIDRPEKAAGGLGEEKHGEPILLGPR